MPFLSCPLEGMGQSLESLSSNSSSAERTRKGRPCHHLHHSRKVELWPRLALLPEACGCCTSQNTLGCPEVITKKNNHFSQFGKQRGKRLPPHPAAHTSYSLTSRENCHMAQSGKGVTQQTTNKDI